MSQIILLKTDWACDYWHTSKSARYPGNVSYTDLPTWEELTKSCPVAGLGIYYKGKKGDCSKIPFVYIRVKGMEYDPGTGNPSFHFDVFQVSSAKSDCLLNKLPRANKRLISTIQASDLTRILSELGESPPNEWLQLIERVTPTSISPSWRDYVGKYFLAVEQSSLSDNEFEDRIASLLKALGFVVTQKGHTRQGSNADGIAIYEKICIVYDCKNTDLFLPTESDIRALKLYTTDEKTLQSSEIPLYSAFIARNFQRQPQQSTFHIKAEPLLYLLSVKLVKGRDFNLNPFKLIFQKQKELSRKPIDEFWSI